MVKISTTRHDFLSRNKKQFISTFSIYFCSLFVYYLDLANRFHRTSRREGSDMMTWCSAVRKTPLLTFATSIALQITLIRYIPNGLTTFNPAWLFSFSASVAMRSTSDTHKPAFYPPHLVPVGNAYTLERFILISFLYIWVFSEKHSSTFYIQYTNYFEHSWQSTQN